LKEIAQKMAVIINAAAKTVGVRNPSGMCMLKSPSVTR
jgi:hypothetical protein